MDITTSFNAMVHEQSLEHLSTEEFRELQDASDTLLRTTELDPAPPAREIVVTLMTQAFLAGIAWSLEAELPADDPMNTANTLERPRGEAELYSQLARERDAEITQAPLGAGAGIEDGLIVLRLRPAQAASLLEFLIGGDE